MRVFGKAVRTYADTLPSKKTINTMKTKSMCVTQGEGEGFKKNEYKMS